MRLSEDKISHLSHVIVDGLKKEGLVDYPDPKKVLKETKQVITQYCKLDDEVEDAVRKKLKSYSRNILEGSREWDVLYKKHFEEEMKKRWR